MSAIADPSGPDPFWFSDYLERMSRTPFNRLNLKPETDEESDPKNTKNTDRWIAEGELIIASESKLKSVPPKKVSDNPYEQAKYEMMERLGPKAKSIIEQMEAGTLPKDDRYQKFIDQVIKRGNEISDEKKN